MILSSLSRKYMNQGGLDQRVDRPPLRASDRLLDPQLAQHRARRQRVAEGGEVSRLVYVRRDELHERLDQRVERFHKWWEDESEVRHIFPVGGP